MAHKIKKPDITDIAGISQKLRNERRIEHIYLVKHGRVILWIEGDERSVNVPEEQLLRFRDGLVLHNHPNGTSFSFDDISQIIVNNVKEMRLFTPKNSFVVKRPESGWNISFTDSATIDAYNKVYYTVTETLEQSYSDGKMTLKEIEDIVNHLLWQRFFDKFGIYYKAY